MLNKSIYGEMSLNTDIEVPQLVAHIHTHAEIMWPLEKQVLDSSGLFPVCRTFMIKSFLFNLPASLFEKGLYL